MPTNKVEAIEKTCKLIQINYFTKKIQLYLYLLPIIY